MFAKVKGVNNAVASDVKAYSITAKVKAFNLVNISFLLGDYF
jgi:S-adenosylmethionine hydrolase